MSKIISHYWACWRSVIMRGLEGLYNNNNNNKKKSPVTVPLWPVAVPPNIFVL